jgi:transposase-like protein
MTGVIIEAVCPRRREIFGSNVECGSEVASKILTLSSRLKPTPYRALFLDCSIVPIPQMAGVRRRSLMVAVDLTG